MHRILCFCSRRKTNTEAEAGVGDNSDHTRRKSNHDPVLDFINKTITLFRQVPFIVCLIFYSRFIVMLLCALLQ